MKIIKLLGLFALLSYIVQASTVSALNASNKIEIYAYNPFIVENRGGATNLHKFTAMEEGMYTLLVNPNYPLDEESYSTVTIYPDSSRKNPIAQQMAYNNEIVFYMVKGETVYIEISPVISSIALLGKNPNYQLHNGWNIFEGNAKSKIIEYTPSETNEYFLTYGPYGGLGTFSGNIELSISLNENFQDIIQSGSEINLTLTKNTKYYIKIKDLNNSYKYLSGRLDLSTDPKTEVLFEEIPTDISISNGKYREFSFIPSEYGMYTFLTDYYGGIIGNSQMDTEILLYDRNHKLLAANSDKVDQANVFSEISTSLSPKEKYFLRVEGYGKRAMDVRVLVTYSEDEINPTPPKLILSKDGWSKEPVVINLTHGNDTGSGVSVSYISIDGENSFPYSRPITIYKEGVTKVNASSMDYWGNTSVSATTEIMIDLTPPTAPKILVESLVKNKTRLSLTSGDDQLSGILRNEYKMGMNGDWKEYKGTIEIKRGSVEAIYARSIDKAGNISSTNNLKLRFQYNYEYDENGKLTAIIDDDSKKSIYKYIYDKNGNLIRVIENF